MNRLDVLAMMGGNNSPGIVQTARNNTVISGASNTLTTTFTKAPVAGNLVVACWGPRTVFANSATPPTGWTVAGHSDRGTILTTEILYWTGGGAAPTSLTMQVQGQTITVSGTPTGGTFTLTDGTHTTGTIAFNASASTVSAALIAGGITGWAVAGGPGPGTAWTLTTSSQVAARSLLSMGTNSLTGGSSPTVTVTATNIQLFLDLFEFGLTTASTVDQVTATDGGVSTINTIHLASITTTTAVEIVVACVQTGASPASVFTWNESFIVLPGTGVSDRLSCAYRITTTTGTFDPTINWTAVQSASGLIVAFK